MIHPNMRGANGQTDTTPVASLVHPRVRGANSRIGQTCDGPNGSSPLAWG